MGSRGVSCVLTGFFGEGDPEVAVFEIHGDDSCAIGEVAEAVTPAIRAYAFKFCFGS